MTQARQKTGADQPPKGGGRYLSNEIISSKEAVFGIVGVEYDGENAYQGTPRPRWLLDIVPWYESEQLPIEDEKGRIGGTDGGRVYVSSRAGIDELMETLQDRLEDMPDDQRIEGPAVLVRRRHPNGKARYYDICEWDEEGQRPILDDGGDEMIPAEEEPPRRPSGRSAAQRAGTARPSQRRAAAQEPEENDEPEEEQERPPARSRPTASSRPASNARSTRQAPAEQTSFADARGAESDGPEAVPARAQQQEDAGAEPAFSLSSGDLQLINDALGIPADHPDAFTSAAELAEEYVDEERFPDIKTWLRDHGVPEKRKGERGPGFPPGRGRIDDTYRNAYALALRSWEELVDWVDAQPEGTEVPRPYIVNGDETEESAAAEPEPYMGNGDEPDDVDEEEPEDEEPELDPRGDAAVRTSPNPAVRSGAVVPTGQRPPSSSVPAPGIAARTRMRQAEVPENAGHQRDARRPADQAQREATAASKAAWMPPDQRERGGARPAQQQDYSPGDEGRSLAPCPGGCGPNGVEQVVTGRAMPNGSGGFVIMHQCPADNTPRPLQAELTGRKV